MGGITIRNINLEDIPYIRECVELCPPLDLHTPFTYWVLANYYKQSSFVMLDQDKIIGFIIAIKAFDDRIYIWQIGLMEKYRHKGFSHLLIDKVIEVAMKNDVSVIQLSMVSDNLASLGTFENYFAKRNLKLNKIGEITLSDFLIPDFSDFEDLYEVNLK